MPDPFVTANSLPIADAGEDQIIYEGMVATFNVSNSFDTDGCLVKYEFDFGDGTNYTWIPSIQELIGTDILVYVTQPGGAYDRTMFDGELPETLEEEGFNVDISGRDLTVITPWILDDYDQLWIISTNYTSSGTFTFNPMEIDAILNFQENGGGLVIMADHALGGGSFTTDANQISTNFNVTFSGYIDHGHKEIYPFIEPHPLSDDLTSIWGHWSESFITKSNPDVQVIAVYNGYNMIAVLDEYVEGRVVFDTSWVRMLDKEDTNHNITLANNTQYAKNIAKWVGTKYISEPPPLVYHTYGDDGNGTDGVYTMNLTITDIEGGTANDTCIVTVNNLEPTIQPFGPFIIEESFPLSITANATDPGSDDLTFIWDWGDGTSDNITVYYNDGLNPDPYPSPFGEFPFSANDKVFHSYENEGIYTINLTVEDDDGGVDVYSTYATVICISPPTLYINVSADKKNVTLYWDSPSSLGIDHYLIYRSSSQTGFDFNVPWVNTSIDNESGETGPIPLRTMWNDTNAASNLTCPESYYIIRAVNIFGKVSSTSRTVGKWTKAFGLGKSTFSLPLEPLETMNMTIDYCLKDMDADYIKWMDSVTHIWMKHGEGCNNDTQLEVGKGYEVKFGNQTNYTFTGMPGAMISYDDDSGFFGFEAGNEAKSLTAIVDPITGNITLNWTKPSNMGVFDEYFVLRSNARDGFWTENYIQLANLSFDVLSYTDIGNATAGTQYYYMIRPVNETGVKGASAYSLGVWTASYLEQYDTIGIPLKIGDNKTADWYCDNIPDTVGINYYNVNAQRWSWHSTRMSEGAFDPLLVMSEGYQISTSNATMFTFIGV